MVDIFHISYTQVQYDMVSANNFEILFEESNYEMNCRKHFKITKSNVPMKKRIYKRETYLIKVNNNFTKQNLSIKKEEKLFLI